jgi:putative transcriptional regulator
MRYNLKVARRLSGYKPADMARKLNISLSFYYKIEAGSRDPSFSLAIEIHNILGGDYRELFEISEPFK